MGSGSLLMLLGEDGQGYELARKLEGCGAWRAWLGGDSAAYSIFLKSLSSPSAWDAFMSSSSDYQSSDNSQIHLHLQLRARALLFDKASISLFLNTHTADTTNFISNSSATPNPNPSSSSSSSSNLPLNPDYLQLHGDDIFFSLEKEEDDDEEDEEEEEDRDEDEGDRQHNIHQLVQPRPASKLNEHTYERTSVIGPRYDEPKNVSISRRHRHDELPEMWYDQYFEKFKARYHSFPHGDKESLKRTSEGMSAYLKLCDMHKKKRRAFKDDLSIDVSESMPDNASFMPPKVVSDTNNSTEEELSFFPEIMFPSNCIPDSSLPLRNGTENHQKVDFNGILDNLPTVVSRSTAMMERFGIRPEYIRVGNKYRGIDGSGCEKQPLCQKQASLMTRKIVARLLSNAGFEGGTAVSMEVFSEFFSSHICRLGSILKLLTDSYKKQFSSIELLQMFLQTVGYNNLGALIESTKDGNKTVIAQTPQQVRAIQPQHQNSLLQAAQQLQRQMHPHTQINTPHSQNLAFQQQQQQQLRRRQDQQQSVVNVKMENLMESSPFDMSTFNSLSKPQQMQWRQHQQQQQQIAMTNHQQQQFRQLQTGQIPQLQAQNAYGTRARPVKVEAFNDLIGGDPTVKRENEHNKLASPSK